MLWVVNVRPHLSFVRDAQTLLIICNDIMKLSSKHNSLQMTDLAELCPFLGWVVGVGTCCVFEQTFRLVVLLIIES